MKTKSRGLFRRAQAFLSGTSRRIPVGSKKSFRRSRPQVEWLESRNLLATLYVDNAADFVITSNVGDPGLSAGDTVTFNPGAGSAHGSAIAGLTFGTNAFSSIQAAVDASTAGDEIRVGPGTFAESVTVNKQLTLLGNQAGVDAQSAARVSASETIVTGVGNNGVTPIHITASGVEVNGFTIEGATNVNQFGFGILLGAGTSGSENRHKIIQKIN